MARAMKVAIIDDEKDMRQSISQWLALSGFDTETFESAEAALRSIGPDYAGVVVSDIRMPGMDGMALLRRLMTLDSALPVILITAHGDVPMAVEAMRLGAFDFLEKPFNPDRMTELAKKAGQARRMALDSRALRRELADGTVLMQKLIGASAPMVRLREDILDLGQADGHVLIDGEIGLYVPAPNLTTGVGGIGSTYTDADWERPIRHGVGGDNRVLAIMPSHIYQHYSDEDLGAVIAYLKSVPAVDNDLGSRRVGFPGSVIVTFMGFDDLTHINGVDHANVGKDVPEEGETAVYGKYLVSIAMCTECHGANLAGIVLAEGEDGPPEGPNLTPGGELADWTEQDFIIAVRTGETPAGDQLDSEQMPWPTLGQMTDTELQAIWAYLSSLPALPDNG